MMPSGSGPSRPLPMHPVGVPPPPPAIYTIPDDDEEEQEKKKPEEENQISKDELEMMKIMGFTGFTTTKNKKVKNNDVSGVHISSKRKYRQYMNRKGGFNRPLDAIM